VENKFVNITESNIDREHLCCIIRSKKPHKGIEVKCSWLAERIKEGHIFRKLDVNGCAFIEYAPLNKAWVPIISDNNDFYYIYCLWVTGEQKDTATERLLWSIVFPTQKARNCQVSVCLEQKSKRHGFRIRTLQKNTDSW